MKIEDSPPDTAGPGPVRFLKNTAAGAWASAAVSGLLMTAAFPKTGFWPLAWFALVPLIRALSPDTGAPLRPSDAFRFGTVSGIVHYMTLLYWLIPTIHTYGGLPFVAAVPILMLLAVYLGLYWGLFFMLLARFPINSLWRFFVWPAAWVTLSWLRGHLFTGFPWGSLGYSQYPWTECVQIAEWTGVYGVSFLIILANLLIHQLLFSRTAAFRRWAIAGVLIVAAGLIHGLGWVRIGQVTGDLASHPTLTAILVQGNVSQDRKWDPEFQDETIDRYIRLSTRALSSPADVVIWPETASPFYFGYDGIRSLELRNFAIRHHTALCTGIPTFSLDQDRQPCYYNTALLIDDQGEAAGLYHKSHLVPFGEYVPLKPFLPFIGKIVAQVGDFSRGVPGSILTVNGRHTGPLICYEMIFPELSRLAVRRGAECLINLTNDAWFGSTSGPFQHFSMGVFRAVENRRPLIRSANTGISGHIDAAGRIRETTRLQTEAAVRVKAALPDRLTVYTRWGDLFSFLCMGISAVFLLRRIRKKDYNT